MGKKSRRKQSTAPARPRRPEIPFVERPFEGLPGEADWVALREVVPAASAKVRTTAEYGARDITVVTLLPNLWPALHRSDGEILVALQTAARSGDASRDVAAAILAAIELEPAEPLTTLVLEPGPRLQDVLDLTVDFEVEVHADFGYWIGEDEERTGELEQAVKDSSEQIVPTVKVEGAEAAYWCRMGREFLRWARSEPQEELLDALARLQVERTLELEEGARFVGAFRSSGLLVPVWELAPGTEAEELTEPVQALDGRLAAALAVTEPLDPAARRARAGIVARQVTLR